MNSYDVVTFDMGYTLMYFHPSELDLALEGYHALGLHPDREALRQARDLAYTEYFGNAAQMTFEPNEERDREIEEGLIRSTLLNLGMADPALVGPLMAVSKSIFKAPCAVRLYPEVPSVLQTLRAQGFKLGIISNWSWDLHDYVEQLDLQRYFDVVIASARAGCEKPHPNIFRQTLQALSCVPQRAIHIGDSYEADVLGARGVGMDAIWLDRAGRGEHDDCPIVRDLTGVLDKI